MEKSRVDSEHPRPDITMSQVAEPFWLMALSRPTILYRARRKAKSHGPILDNMTKLAAQTSGCDAFDRGNSKSICHQW